jgi:ADP-ribose diphosphatase
MEKTTDKRTKPVVERTRTIAKTRLFNVEEMYLTFSNGATRIYERLRGSGRGAVMVVPVTDDNKLILIREYAAGTEDYELGFPKGLIDPGESVLEAANRELKEEVGFGATEWVELKQLTMAPAYFASQMTILLAKSLYPETLPGDEPEPLEQLLWPIDQISELIRYPDFTEARSVAAAFLVQAFIDRKGG